MPALPTTPRIRFLIVVTLGVLGCAASGVGTPSLDGKLALGTWGGDNAGMIVGDTAMHLHVGCTYGDVSGRIAIAADGSFDVRGTFMLRAYPVAVGPTVPARFRGQISGSSATVTATVDDTVTHTVVIKGPVTVKYGDEPRLGPCPICRRPILTLPSGTASSPSVAVRTPRTQADR